MSESTEPTREVVEGVSHREGDERHASFQKALENLWEDAGPDKKMLRVIEIEIHGSNPIDMFRVIATKH